MRASLSGSSMSNSPSVVSVAGPPASTISANTPTTLNTSMPTSQPETEPVPSTVSAKTGGSECDADEDEDENGDEESTGSSAALGTTPYDRARLARIEANRRKMKEMGLDKLAQGIRLKKAPRSRAAQEPKKPAQAPTQGPTWTTRSQTSTSTVTTALTPPDAVLPPPTTPDAVGTAANNSTPSSELAPGGCAIVDGSARPASPTLGVDINHVGSALGTPTFQATSFILLSTAPAPATTSEAAVLMSSTSQVGARGGSEAAGGVLTAPQSQLLHPESTAAATTSSPLTSGVTSLQLTSSTSSPALGHHTTTPPSLVFTSNTDAPLLGVQGLALDVSSSHAAVPDANGACAFAIIDDKAPGYVTEALEFLSDIEGGGDSFRELVELWQLFELRMGYPGNTQVSTASSSCGGSGS